MSSSVAAAFARPGDDGHCMDMWTARVCMLASSRPPQAKMLFHARYHITVLSLDCGVKQRKAEALLLSLLHVLGHSQGQVFLTLLLPINHPSQFVRCLQVLSLDYIKGSCCVFCELDLHTRGMCGGQMWFQLPLWHAGLNDSAFDWVGRFFFWTLSYQFALPLLIWAT